MKEIINVKELQNKEVVITPFCIESILLYHKMKKEGIRVTAFFDKNPLIWGKCYDGIQIIRPYNKVTGKVIICSSKYEDEITGKLVSLGMIPDNIVSSVCISNMVNDNEIVYEVDDRAYSEIVPVQAWHMAGILKIKKMRYQAEHVGNGPEVMLERFEVHTTERCTLSCKNCASLSPYFEHAKDFDLNSIERDFDTLIDKIDFVEKVIVMGGETLLYKRLPELLYYIHNHHDNYKKIGTVHVLTNGTLLPKEEMIQAFKETNTIVWISNYGMTSTRLDELVLLLSENNVLYEVLNITTWAAVQQLRDGENITADEIKKQRELCITGCRTLRDGKFYLCDFLGEGDALHSFPHDNRNYVDILAKDFSKEKLLNYLSADTLIPGCAWCNGCTTDMWENSLIPVALQTKRPIPYKKY
jgi:hypothetical protein